MSRVFILTDNKVWLNKAKEIFTLKNVPVDFFCSPASNEIFYDEIESGLVKTINLKKDNLAFLFSYKVGFSCHSKQIFPEELIKRVVCINIHPGFNPFNRGWFPQVFSILNNKPVGATIHLMDGKIDHGDILYQKEVEVFDWDTSKTIYERVLSEEFMLFEKHFESLVNLDYSATAPVAEGNYNGISDYKSLLEIDLTRTITMKEAIDYLRAMTHPPYDNAFFYTKDNDKVFVEIKLKKVEK